MSYYFSPSLNEVGNLATGIFKYDFDSNTGSAVEWTIYQDGCKTTWAN